MSIFFAHGSEHHAEPAVTLILLGEWYIALPLFLLAVAGVSYLAYLIGRKSKPVAYLATVVTLFLGGVGLYQFSPVSSIAGLTLGFALTLTIVASSLVQSETS